MGIGFSKVMLHSLPGGIPVLTSFGRLNPSFSGKLPKVINAHRAFASELLKGQEMCHAFDTGLQIEIKGMFYGQANKNQ